MQKRTLLSLALSGTAFALFTNLAFASTTAVLTPTTEGNYLQLTPSTGSTHYTLVDESSCNGTTDYNYTSTVGYRDSYGINISTIGNGASISQIAVAPCASRNSGSGGGSSTFNVFYRYNGTDSSDTGSYALSGTTPTNLATSTYSSLSLFKTNTSTLEIGGVYTSGTRGVRLSRMATVLTYSLSSPSAPTSLTATDYSSSQINLAWTDNSSNETMFRIYRSQNGGSYSLVATTTWNTVAYNNTGLTADQTYSYKVDSFNDAGTATSNVSTAITYNTAPSAPSSLSASSYGSDVVLSWTDNSTNEDNFLLERSIDNVNFSNIATTTLNFTSSTSVTDVGAASGSYYYRVKAKNTIGSSSYSNTYEYNIVSTPPDVPTSLSATNYSSTQNNLTWSDNSSDEDGFKVYRAQNGGSYDLATTTIANTTAYNDTGLTADQTFSYYVVAFNAAGTATSNIATTVTYYSTAAAPSSLSAVSSSNSIILTWIDNSANEDGFSIERSTDNSSFSEIATTTRNLSATSTYTDTTITPGLNYYYRLSAYNQIGYSGYSNVASTLKVVEVSGNISSPTTWEVGNIYVINSLVTVSAPLTINAGVIVKFRDNTSALKVTGGPLDVQGTSVSMVYFTSYKDGIGGDTDGSSTSTPAAGDWGYIYINSYQANSIDWASIRYGGGCDLYYMTLYSVGGTLTISNSEVGFGANIGINAYSGTMNISHVNVHDNGDFGIKSSAATIDLSDSTVEDNASEAVSIDIGYSTFTHSGNTISGNGTDAFVFYGYNHNQIWNVDGAPYLIDSSVYIPSGYTLTIEAGAIIKFRSSNGAIVVNGGAVLKVAGTENDKVYFTSYHDDIGGNTDGSSTPPAKYDWDYIKLESTGSSTLAWAVVRYGGSANSRDIYNYFGTITLSHVEISDADIGYQQYHATGAVADCSIHNTGTGINANNYGSLDLTDTIFANNDTDLNIYAEVTYTHSGIAHVEEGELTSDTTWDTDAIHVVDGTLTVTSGTTLTINPGVIVKFKSATSSIVVDGTLSAIGTSASSIYFTSYHDDIGGNTDGVSTAPAAGDWDTIKLKSGSTATLAQAKIRYGGYTYGSSASVYNHGGNLSLLYTDVATSTTSGIKQDSGTSIVQLSDVGHNDYGFYLLGGTATVTSTKVHENTSDGVYSSDTTATIKTCEIYANENGIYVAGGDPPTVADNAIYGNTSYGLYSALGSNIDPNNNFWGSWEPPGEYEPFNGVTSDKVTVNATPSTWCHVIGAWNVQDPVQAPVLKWTGSTKYYDAWNSATATWSDVSQGVGLIELEHVATGTLGAVTVSDESLETTTTFGITLIASSTITFNTTGMDYLNERYFPDGPIYWQNVATHELGHALGLGHSMTVPGDNVMHGFPQPIIDLGDQDKSDYGFIWVTMRWAVSSWWYFYN